MIFSGGRPEGSKRNLNFQSATWHHLKHFHLLVAILSPKNVKSELRHPDLVLAWDICNV